MKVDQLLQHCCCVQKTKNLDILVFSEVRIGGWSFFSINVIGQNITYNLTWKSLLYIKCLTFHLNITLISFSEIHTVDLVKKTYLILRLLWPKHCTWKVNDWSIQDLSLTLHDYCPFYIYVSNKIREKFQEMSGTLW